MAESQNNNNQPLKKQEETGTVKFRYSEGRVETINEYNLTKPDGTNIKGVKTSINDYKILEGEGKIDEVSKKLDSLGKSPTLQLEQQALGENPETKIPEIIQEQQTSQGKTSPEEKLVMVNAVDKGSANNNSNNSGSEGSEN